MCIYMEMRIRGTDSVSIVSLQLNISVYVTVSSTRETRWAGALRLIVKRSYALGIFLLYSKSQKCQLCYNFCVNFQNASRQWV